MQKVYLNEAYALFDVSRIVIRNIKGRHPTGVDNVLKGFIEEFNGNYTFLIRYKFLIFIISSHSSKNVFSFIQNDKKIPLLTLIFYLLKNIYIFPYAFLKKFNVYYNLGHNGADSRTFLKIIKFISKENIFLIHDLIPIRFPKFCIDGEKDRHERRMKNIVDFSSKIIFNSNITEKHFFNWLDEKKFFYNKKKTKVIKPASSLIFSSNQERKHFCMVGTIEPRKGYEEIIELFRRSDNPPFRLIIIGQPGWKCDEQIEDLEKLDKERKLVWLKDCDNKKLKEVMSSSIALIQNSKAEGFGLSIIEALDNQLHVFVRYSEEIEKFCNKNITYFRDEIELLQLIQNKNYSQRKIKYVPSRTWKDACNDLLLFSNS